MFKVLSGLIHSPDPDIKPIRFTVWQGDHFEVSFMDHMGRALGAKASFDNPNVVMRWLLGNVPMCLRNYQDSKCVYGYMTLCNRCKDNAPAWVNTSVIVSGFPAVKCELCP